MGALEVSATLELRYFTTTSACRNAYGQYVYTLVLQTNNNRGNPGAEQTLFDQITFGRNVIPGTKVFNWCYEYEAANSGNAFCLDDDVRASGGYFVVYPGSGVSSFDVLPRLPEVLHNGHKKANLNVSLDTDASHWVVKAIYVGGILQGQTNDTIRLSDIRMNSYAGGSFSNGIQTAYTCGQGKPPFAGWVDAGSGCFHRNTGKAY